MGDVIQGDFRPIVELEPIPCPICGQDKHFWLSVEGVVCNKCSSILEVVFYNDQEGEDDV